MNPLAITDYTLTSALGPGLSDNWRALQSGESGLRPCTFGAMTDLDTWAGEVVGVDDVALPAALGDYNCRNNRLAWIGLQQDGFMDAVERAVQRHGASRVGVFIGTSTSGIYETELAYQSIDFDTDPPSGLPQDYCYYGSHNAYSAAEFVRVLLFAYLFLSTR